MAIRALFPTLIYRESMAGPDLRRFNQDMADECRSLADRWVDAWQLSDAELAECIEADGIDEWFLCGPIELVTTVRDALLERDVVPGGEGDDRSDVAGH